MPPAMSDRSESNPQRASLTWMNDRLHSSAARSADALSARSSLGSTEHVRSCALVHRPALCRYQQGPVRDSPRSESASPTRSWASADMSRDSPSSSPSSSPPSPYRSCAMRRRAGQERAMRSSALPTLRTRKRGERASSTGAAGPPSAGVASAARSEGRRREASSQGRMPIAVCERWKSVCRTMSGPRLASRAGSTECSSTASRSDSREEASGERCVSTSKWSSSSKRWDSACRAMRKAATAKNKGDPAAGRAITASTTSEDSRKFLE
mmetsp:Transcript_28482/g.65624  ORF Transcript_28482/g.65624 Transcript_28482/m.65624 type:complete len:268 (+) Transcript_28482:528-1331(+)